ncbi:MAG: hypothetical protein GY737_23420 [Desulfobacteraceae bacterium]|nr:hypothetical protein [Desulfobacteraceae bacterium]
MESILADYHKDTNEITILEGAKQENWVEVCTRYNDDVERICDVTAIESYTGLYECFDDANKGVFYLVNEDKRLFKLRRKHFLSNIGKGENSR